jgi:hypothetical protein
MTIARRIAGVCTILVLFSALLGAQAESLNHVVQELHALVRA